MLMIAIQPTLIIPLQTDEHGVIRVSGTRVTLESLIGCYWQGFTAEQMHDAFDAVPLADAYAVIAYYLSHKDEVDAYVTKSQAEGERIRGEWEARYTPEQKARTEEFKALLEARRRKAGS